MFIKKKRKRIVFMASGRGSNFEAVLNKIKNKTIVGADPILLISDNANAGALKIAAKNNMRSTVVDFNKYKSNRQQFDQEILKKLDSARADLIVACGFMKVLGEIVVAAYKYRIINIHPSLLPAFPGLNAQKQALQYGVRITGATTHFIDSGIDTGPIILQSCVAIKKKYDLSALSKIILKIEHDLLPKTVDLFCRDKIKIENGKVIIL